MKLCTVLGTRPEIIRLSRIIPRLDASCEHVLVHTGQNSDPRLSDIFFSELGVRQPDHYLGASGSLGSQLGTILAGMEGILRQGNFDRMLILGDTNSGLAAIIAKRMGVAVYHMEAGNRCFDDRVPEEVNRRVIDHASDVLMPYTAGSRDNLLREGVHPARVLVTGNPIREVMDGHAARIAASRVLGDLHLTAGGFFLATMHRAENVDDPQRLAALCRALDGLVREHGLPVVVSTHPRTRDRLDALGLAAGEGVRFLPPFGLADFLRLERSARCVLTDSGTVQEECCLLMVPSVTMRDTTERPETLECGSNILAGVEPESVLRCVRTALAQAPAWTPPAEYLAENVSDRVCRILLGRTPYLG